jgi:hypothetical protein
MWDAMPPSTIGATMNRRTTYLSFWDIEMSNIPVRTVFRRRALSTAEARGMFSSARAAGALVCVSKADLAAPYCERERESHKQLCAALREHTDIDIHLKDFFGVDCFNPLCLAEIGSQSSLLVVDCHYAFDDDATRGDAKALDASDLDGMSEEQAVRRIKDSMKMSIVPDSIAFYLFEQIEPDAVARISGAAP